MALTLPGMAAFLSACATLALGLVGLVLALALAAMQGADSGSGFWRKYVRIATAPLALAVSGLLWATYLNSAGADADRYTLWPPITGGIAALCAFGLGRRV